MTDVTRETLAPKNEVIRLVLPYPPSGNRYWRHAIIEKHVQVYPSKEAKLYKAGIARAARELGITPILGPIEYELLLYPHRPQDWEKRVKKDPVWWDLTVQRLDLDNCRKVLLDALNGICWTDDSKVMKDPGEVMVPDGEARVEITVRPYLREHPQGGLFPMPRIDREVALQELRRMTAPAEPLPDSSPRTEVPKSEAARREGVPF